MFKVSQSKVNTWRRCTQAYHNKYVLKLKKIKKARPLMFGSIVHDMDEAAMNGDDPFKVLDAWYKQEKKLFRDEVAMYGDIIEDIRLLYKEYQLTHPEKSLLAVRINKRNAEHEFEVPINKNVLFVGKIDRIVKAKGMRWLYERKTFTKYPSEDVRWRSIQSASYIAAMAIMGWPSVDGTCWDYFSSKPPSMPEILKSGKISTRDINTLPSKVLQFAAENKLSRAEVQPLLKKAIQRRDSYFPRVFTPIQPRVVNAVMQDFIATSNDMAKHHGTRREKNIGPHCSWCDFELLCRAELQGLDIKTIKERNYRYEDFKKPEKPEVVSE